jgi:hypothetical protein
MTASTEFYDIRLKNPSSLMLVGPSRSGKTSWLLNCLQNADVLFTTKPAYTIFYYGAWQDIYDQMNKLGLVQEWKNECPQRDYIETVAERYKSIGGVCVIIDDLLTTMNKDMAELFLVVSHHSNVTVFFLSQALFFDDRHFRSMKGSVNYVVLFKNPNTHKQVTSFFGDIRPRTKDALTKTYEKVTKKPYSYLLCDLHQETPEEVQFRTNIFPHEGGVIAFVPPK